MRTRSRRCGAILGLGRSLVQHGLCCQPWSLGALKPKQRRRVTEKMCSGSGGLHGRSPRWDLSRVCGPRTRCSATVTECAPWRFKPGSCLVGEARPPQRRRQATSPNRHLGRRHIRQAPEEVHISKQQKNEKEKKERKKGPALA